MDACVGSPGTRNARWDTEKRRYRLLEHRLNGWPVGLHLPAMVIRPVILHRQLNIHGDVVGEITDVGLEIVPNQDFRDLNGI